MLLAEMCKQKIGGWKRRIKKKKERKNSNYTTQTQTKGLLHSGTATHNLKIKK